jgi:predicted secreted protein
MADTGTTLGSGIVKVEEAGKRVRIETSAGTFAAKTIIIQALGTNEGEIVVGDKEVVAAPGTHAAPTQRGIALAAKATISIDIIDTAGIWIDTTKSKDAVSWVALLA